MSPPWTNLASLAIGGPLYGLYVVLYLTSTTILVRRSNRAHTGPLYRSTVFITGLILFVAVTGVSLSYRLNSRWVT
jgi:cytochrome c oxidase assembly factor CtaG